MPVIPSEPASFPAAHGSNNENPSNSSEQRDAGQDTKKASMLDHLSKGPQIPDSMPPTASKEEIEARKKELNQ
ncbi:uncharacterized protein BP01DRAFT_391914 [Aspergillus saccharolyticus JOP 1030-1]|uniref:Uncharacterized protein n=1 Tax=Aspergillus saccharolyticus JOP 1030-1 TaxID=1450539 RepID=A0A318ZG64_9EURO|nr:hypothetical protein BP01DRAFT_391914 [Aspergillus saccharolyticus JOP 1030-1]PYH45354.1 hypothetical protein BP01DRAFT_391914 [Aspergillus saccharolyticus JOP 1030-1]